MITARKRALQSGSLIVVTLALLTAGMLVALAGCSTTYPRRNPTGETFPTVTGNALSGEAVTLPQDLAGKPAILLIGFEQDTQFDLDRWILGLVQSGTDTKILELPTIPGMVPGMFAKTIDNGMRRGIPKEDWGSVVTLYDEAAPVAKFTGNDDGLPGRIVLLDATGKVVFFHDRGYSAGTLQKLLQEVERL